MVTSPLTNLTGEEYLRLERLAEGKSEFHDGQKFSMAGGSLNHSLLTSRVIALLDRLVPAGCRVFSSDMRIKIPTSGIYTYSDCAVVCCEPQLSSEQQDNLLNPTLIVEVLSPLSEAYDRGKKFEMYRTMESLREYLLVHQDRRHVEHYAKQDDGSWVLREYAGATAKFEIAQLSAIISLAELYATAIGLD